MSNKMIHYTWSQAHKIHVHIRPDPHMLSISGKMWETHTSGRNFRFIGDPRLNNRLSAARFQSRAICVFTFTGWCKYDRDWHLRLRTKRRMAGEKRTEKRREGWRTTGERERDTKRHTSLPYLHVAAAMTGNLAKFSTELAADGEEIERERGKSKGTMEVKEEMCGRGRVPTAWRHLAGGEKEESKWVSRFQSRAVLRVCVCVCVREGWSLAVDRFWQFYLSLALKI